MRERSNFSWECGRATRLTWFGVMLFLLLGSACFDPFDIIEKESIKLRISGMLEGTHILRLELTECEGNRILGTRVLERKISASFGDERFYLPAYLQGKTIDLTVEGLSSQRETVQYLRVRSKVEPIQGFLPRLVLKGSASVPGHKLCAFPQEKSPENPKVEPERVVNIPGRRAQPVLDALPAPWSPGDKPLPSLPSSDDLADTLSLLTTYHFVFPVWPLASQGKLVAVATAANDIELIDVTTGTPVVPTYKLRPDGCQPKAADIQGDILAVLCTKEETSRLLLLSIHKNSREYSKSLENEQGRYYGPREGFSVGKNPIAVKISGHLAVVLNRGGRNLSIIRFDRMSDPEPLVFPKSKQEVWEDPVAMFLVGRDIYIVDKNRSSLYHYRVDREGQVTVFDDKRKSLKEKQPLQIAANQRYLVASYRAKERKEWGIKVWLHPQNTTGREKSKLIPLDYEPGKLSLLSHTLLVTHNSPSGVTWVDLRTKKAKTVLLSHPAEFLAVTGERIMVGSPKSNKLQVLQFGQSRHGLRQWRSGSAPSRILWVENTGWLFDPLSKRLQAIEVTGKQLYARASYFLPKAESLSHRMVAHPKFLVYSGAAGREVYFRRLPPRPELEPKVMMFHNPVLAMRLYGDTLYLLHGTNGELPASLTTISLTGEDPFQLKRENREFQTDNKTWHPVDLLPWSKEAWVLADKQNNALYLLNSKDLTRQRTLYSGEERLTPERLVRLGNQLAVLLDGGKIMMVNMRSFAKAGKLLTPFDGSPLSEMVAFDRYLLVTDQKNDVVLVCEPTRAACSYLSVGCKPGGMAVVGAATENPSLLTGNSCDGSLSWVPLKAYLPTD